MSYLPKSHRTVLFVDGPALKNNASYMERVKRLDQSLNGANIKVDIFTVFPEKTTSAGIVSGIATSPAADDTNYFNNDRLRELGQERGYVQTLISNPTKGGW